MAIFVYKYGVILLDCENYRNNVTVPKVFVFMFV